MLQAKPVCTLVQDHVHHVQARKITFPEGSFLHEGAARQEQLAMELVLSIRSLTPAEAKTKLRFALCS